MLKRLKPLFSALPALFILITLTGCADKDTASAEKSASSPNSGDDAVAQQPVAEKKLAVAGHRCSGCGLCVRVDPEHFRFDSVSRKAAVNSNGNLNSDNLLTAISICRERAIEIL